MKHWIGRQVVIHLEQHERVLIKGMLRKWDASGFCIVRGMSERKIYFHDISKIEIASSDHKDSDRSLLHSVGYTLTTDIQFANAIYFKSFVMVWHKDKLMAYGSRIISHDNLSVSLVDGSTWEKDQVQIIVRSLRSFP